MDWAGKRIVFRRSSTTSHLQTNWTTLGCLMKEFSCGLLLHVCPSHTFLEWAEGLNRCCGKNQLEMIGSQISLHICQHTKDLQVMSKHFYWKDHIVAIKCNASGSCRTPSSGTWSFVITCLTNGSCVAQKRCTLWLRCDLFNKSVWILLEDPWCAGKYCM